MPGPRRVFLFGNGLSLCFDADYYRLANITERVRDRLGRMRGRSGVSLLHDLEPIGRAVGKDTDPRRITSFEQIAGPIDRLSNVLSEVGPLSLLAEDDVEVAALSAMRQRLRQLYRRIVGVVLENVMDHGGSERNWPFLLSIADHLRQEAERQGEVDVFTLNYDALLEAALLRVRRQRREPAFDLADEFSGLETHTIGVLGVDETIHNVSALRWRGDIYNRSDRPLIRLHHLHGAGTWLRYRGDIYKARALSELRACRLYTSWAEGIEGQEDEGEWVAPSVLLGDQKETWVTIPPFNESYERLAWTASTAEELVVAGYGFGDLPLNRALRDYRDQSDARVHVVNSGWYVESRARDALGRFGYKTEWLSFDRRGLPEGLVLAEGPPET